MNRHPWPPPSHKKKHVLDNRAEAVQGDRPLNAASLADRTLAELREQVAGWRQYGHKPTWAGFTVMVEPADAEALVAYVDRLLGERSELLALAAQVEFDLDRTEEEEPLPDRLIDLRAVVRATAERIAGDNAHLETHDA